MRGQGSRLSLLLRQRIRKNGTKLLPIKSAVSSESYCLVPCRSPASALFKRGPGLNSSGYNLPSSKKEKGLHMRFKDYVLTNLQALYRSSKVEFENRTLKKWFF